jgi:hypothetical protein
MESLTHLNTARGIWLPPIGIKVIPSSCHVPIARVWRGVYVLVQLGARRAVQCSAVHYRPYWPLTAAHLQNPPLITAIAGGLQWRLLSAYSTLCAVAEHRQCYRGHLTALIFLPGWGRLEGLRMRMGAAPRGIPLIKAKPRPCVSRRWLTFSQGFPQAAALTRRTSEPCQIAEPVE